MATRAKTKCDFCPIRKGCDWLSELCRLSASEVVEVRPDLIRPLTKHQRYYQANKDKYRVWNNAASKRYRSRHRDRRLQTERNWRAKHPEVLAAGKQRWWNRNKERINAERRERRQNERELCTTV